VKSLVLSLILACPLTVALRPALGQTGESPEQKHLMAWSPTVLLPISLSALNIVRGAEFPTVVHLEGNVQVTKAKGNRGPGARSGVFASSTATHRPAPWNN
jgi:hypothetical protein